MSDEVSWSRGARRLPAPPAPARPVDRRHNVFGEMSMLEVGRSSLWFSGNRIESKGKRTASRTRSLHHKEVEANWVLPCVAEMLCTPYGAAYPECLAHLHSMGLGLHPVRIRRTTRDSRWPHNQYQVEVDSMKVI